MTTETETKTDAPADPGPSSTKFTKDGWKKQAVHEGVTLPSGAVVSIKLPNVGQMIKSATIPNALIDQALAQQNATEITAEMLEQSWDYTRFIVPRTVVNPQITEDDVDDLPAEDVEMLVAFAARSIDLDAVGHQLGGLETQQSFRDLRGLFSSDAAGLNG